MQNTNALVTTNPELSDDNRSYWEQQLVYAEKAVEVAKRMLGIIVIEEVPDEHEESNPL